MHTQYSYFAMFSISSSVIPGDAQNHQTLASSRDVLWKVLQALVDGRSMVCLRFHVTLRFQRSFHSLRSKSKLSQKTLADKTVSSERPRNRCIVREITKTMVIGL